MIDITEIIIDVPSEFSHRPVEDSSINPEDSMFIRVLLDLNNKYAMNLWSDITSRGVMEYTFATLDLKRRLNLDKVDALKGFLELQKKGYLIQINPTRFKFNAYPERIKTNITEQGEGYTVYKLTFPNGKHYIGKTKKKLKERWRRGSGYKRQEVYKAIIQYGWNNIDKKILATNLSEKEAAKIEHFYIFAYNSFQEGYNKAL